MISKGRRTTRERELCQVAWQGPRGRGCVDGCNWGRNYVGSKASCRRTLGEALSPSVSLPVCHELPKVVGVPSGIHPVVAVQGASWSGQAVLQPTGLVGPGNRRHKEAKDGVHCVRGSTAQPSRWLSDHRAGSGG